MNSVQFGMQSPVFAGTSKATRKAEAPVQPQILFGAHQKKSNLVQTGLLLLALVLGGLGVSAFTKPESNNAAAAQTQQDECNPQEEGYAKCRPQGTLTSTLGGK